MKKSINLENVILSDSGTPIAFLNARVSVGYESLNIVINVVDEKTLSINKGLFKRELDTFLDGIKTEAITNGWEALADNQTE